MTKTHALWTILLISIAGFLFSGFLSFRELVQHSVKSCTPIPAGSRAALPPCVYGMAMYAAVLFVTILGLSRRDRRLLNGMER